MSMTSKSVRRATLTTISEIEQTLLLSIVGNPLTLGLLPFFLGHNVEYHEQGLQSQTMQFTKPRAFRRFVRPTAGTPMIAKTLVRVFGFPNVPNAIRSWINQPVDVEQFRDVEGIHDALPKYVARVLGDSHTVTEWR
jgi:hypothetical protein